MIRKLLTVVALLLLPAGAWAADGDKTGVGNSGDYRFEEFILCDSDTSAVTCAELNLNQASLGTPSFAVFFTETSTSCAPLAYVVRGKRVASGQAHNVTSTLTEIGGATTSEVVEFLAYPVIDVDITTATSCSDIDIYARFYYKRKQ